MEDSDPPVEAGLPNTYYLVVGRLLLVSVCGLTYGIAELMVGSPVALLYSFFAVFCLFRAMQFLWHTQNSLDQVARLYYFLYGANWCMIPWIAAGALYVLFDPRISFAAIHPLFLAACCSVPLDILFCRWAIRKLEDIEFLLRWSKLNHNSGIRRFSIPTVLLWTTVLAGAFGTYSSELRNIGYRTRYYSSNWIPPYQVVATEVAKPLLPGSDSTPILFISVTEGKDGLAPKETDNLELKAGQAERGKMQIYVNGQIFNPPAGARVVFVSEEQVTISEERMSPHELMEYLRQGGDPSSLETIRQGMKTLRRRGF